MNKLHFLILFLALPAWGGERYNLEGEVTWELAKKISRMEARRVANSFYHHNTYRDNIDEWAKMIRDKNDRQFVIETFKLSKVKTLPEIKANAEGLTFEFFGMTTLIPYTSGFDGLILVNGQKIQVPRNAKNFQDYLNELAASVSDAVNKKKVSFLSLLVSESHAQTRNLIYLMEAIIQSSVGMHLKFGFHSDGLSERTQFISVERTSGNTTFYFTENRDYNLLLFSRMISRYLGICQSAKNLDLKNAANHNISVGKLLSYLDSESENTGDRSIDPFFGVLDELYESVKRWNFASIEADFHVESPVQKVAILADTNIWKYFGLSIVAKEFRDAKILEMDTPGFCEKVVAKLMKQEVTNAAEINKANICGSTKSLANCLADLKLNDAEKIKYHRNSQFKDGNNIEFPLKGEPTGEVK